MWAKKLSEPNEKTFMNTLTACVNKVVKDGYTDTFKVTKQGLYAPSKEKYFSPAEVHVLNFYRFEGESDPADNAIMYVIETDDGMKGTLIDAYGPYSDINVTAFMQLVEDLNKKVTDRNHKPEA
ncbi:MAG: hypothetical protein JNL72_03170 [Flavipsychrobacter sp.]|nr:hypothetical protein [Flavipsychrobacter sp.]